MLFSQSALFLNRFAQRRIRLTLLRLRCSRQRERCDCRYYHCFYHWARCCASYLRSLLSALMRSSVAACDFCNLYVPSIGCSIQTSHIIMAKKPMVIWPPNSLLVGPQSLP